MKNLADLADMCPTMIFGQLQLGMSLLQWYKTTMITGTYSTVRQLIKHWLSSNIAVYVISAQLWVL